MNAILENDEQVITQLDTDESGIEVREYLHVLSKFKWGILSVALITGLFGIYTSYKLVPIYQSTAKLQIEREQQARDLTSAFGYSYPNWEFYQTQYQLIQSWSVSELAAEKLGLLDADYLEGIIESPPKEKVRWFNMLPPEWVNLIPSEFIITPRKLTSAERKDGIIAGIQNRMSVKPIEGSQLVNISYEGSDPEMAAREANAVSESYIEFLKDKHLSGISTDQAWYVSRLDQARGALKLAENEFQEFREKQGILETAEGVDAIQTQRLQMALSGREHARQQKIALEGLYNLINKTNEPVALGAITDLTNNGIVRELKQSYSNSRKTITELSLTYGPKHAKMIEAKALLETAKSLFYNELQRAANSIIADYKQALEVERSFTRELELAKVDILKLNRGRAEFAKFQNAVNSSRSLLEKLQAGEKTTVILESGDQKINAFIIEYARPGRSPIRPDKKRMAMMWVMSGLFFGVGLAFVLNHLDNTFRGSKDVENRLATAVIGVLPLLKGKSAEKLEPMNQFMTNHRSAFSEAIRTIRTGVLLSTIDKKKTVVMMTSSVPGEGKTTLSINLAHSLSQVKTTILIDADMRRPMIRKAKNISANKPGLSALITGEATLDDVVDKSPNNPLHIIHAGTIPSNPLELLSSQRFKNLIEQLKTNYDVLIIDSAPALAVSDALIVSQLSDAVIYVVLADSTPYQAAEQGVKRLRRIDAPILGSVLNQVISSGRGYYGKYGKYGAKYGYYTEQYPEYYSERTTKKGKRNKWS